MIFRRVRGLVYGERGMKSLMALPTSNRRAASPAGQLGMTLVEIIMVIALIGGLMAYLFRNIGDTADHAKESQARLAMNQIAQALQMYRIHMGTFPSDTDGLDALVRNTTGSGKWKGPYLEEGQIMDPWDVKIRFEMKSGNRFELISAGLDGQFGTEKDIYYSKKNETSSGES